MIAQLAFNVWAATPATGGATTVWRHRWEPADEQYRQAYGYRPEAVEHCQRVDLTPQPGDGLLFNPANPLAAGAGTLLDEIHARIPGLDTVVVAVGGGGLFAGVATAAHHRGIRTVAVEPEYCRAPNAAIEAGHQIDVMVDSIAADSLGARRTSAMALHPAQQDRVQSVLVADSESVRARQALWDPRRIAVEHGAATALAALTAPHRHAPDRNTPTRPATVNRSYRPGNGEKACAVLCGANKESASTSPSRPRHPDPAQLSDATGTGRGGPGSGPAGGGAARRARAALGRVGGLEGFHRLA
ncbi:pyridoxal-phosphate dependent enzyme [Kitasatospora sp. NPDC047058]|uniref:pyridoxal-phosphate dependent enzyme n=1 Tax=Kitasatospora sp. NPDC047058 TaxID=3155620 RepID=UPI0033D221C8